MFISRIAFVALTVFTFTSALVTPATKRDDADVLNILTTLKGSTDSILPQIDSLVANKQASSSNLTPLFDQVQTALKTATSSLQGLGANKVKRQTSDELSALLAEIIKDINTSATGANSSTLFGLPGIVSAITLALETLLIELNVIVPGILASVVLLLDGVLGVVVGLLLTLLAIL
ncbi:hypothetical protein CPB85DRAFT_1256126 [Mucidula mucida]|nr:hypothetical protein CPB85DRAFT_1460232 [Mucidula mucida]KAF8901992.1 hypothetical protein CPB85DRAFT_1256126 [Mucidula mucida]